MHACWETLAYCARRGQGTALTILLASCAAICEANIKFMAMQSPFYEASAALCAAVCAKCAQECGSEEDEQLKVCGQLCQLAANQSSMVSVLKYQAQGA